MNKKELIAMIENDLKEIEHDIFEIIEDIEIDNYRRCQYERLVGKRQYANEVINYLLQNESDDNE